MNFTTYAELQTSIGDELNRTDLTSAIAGFIRLMEAQTERQLRTRDMIELNTAFVIDDEYVAIPTDMLEVRSIVLNTNPLTILDFETAQNIAEFKQAQLEIGRPSKFSIVGNQFQFARVPDTSYEATLIYFKKFERLSVSNTSNWLLENHPDIYFYGSLLNSAPYLKDDPRVSVWGALYQNAVDALKIADERAQTASNGLKSTARNY